MSDTVIKTENLSKRYIIGHQSPEKYTALRDVIANRVKNILRKKEDISEEFWALQDINFEIKRGDRVGIIGRNGAGKSTLLKILSRITDPSGGRITIRGRVASLLEVGTGFHPELSGRENIFLNGAILGMPRTEIKKKFDEIVEFAEVEKFLDTPVKRYSSGMYVRLAFAVAAHLEPDILVVDEVLAVGDAQFQKKCLGKMEEVSKGGERTILFVSHNMLAIKSLCTKGILLANGKVQFSGSIDQAINKYQLALSPSLRADFENDNKLAGNERIRLNSIELELDDESEVATFLITKPFKIHVRLTNLAIHTPININLFFNTPDGVNIFAACSQGASFKNGSMHLTCEVPANFLNDNIYSIDVMAVTEDTSVLSVKDAITLEGAEPARDSAWLGKFPGYVRPSFNWQIH